MARFNKSLVTFLLFVGVCSWIFITAVGGTRCRTSSRRFGYCALYENCSSLRNSMLFPEMLSPNDCKNSGLSGAVVCCPLAFGKILTPKPTITTTTTTTTTSTTTTTTSTTTTTKPATQSEIANLHPDGVALLNTHSCGTMSYSRVANGENAALDEFPWVAMLLYKANAAQCGGSLITDRFVLTAAHCIIDSLYLVRLGEHTVSTVNDCLPNGICLTHKDFGIEKTISHPGYNRNTHIKDIALIKLNDTIQFATNIKPICLTTTPEEFEISPNRDLVIAGWGLTENERVADVLQKGLLKFESLDKCKETYLRYIVDDSKICTRAGANHTVSCRGDSGGPLIQETSYRMEGGYKKPRYAQIGLVSLGYMYKCGGLTNVPFMFENVTHSMAWITHTIIN